VIPNFFSVMTWGFVERPVLQSFGVGSCTHESRCSPPPDSVYTPFRAIRRSEGNQFRSMARFISKVMHSLELNQCSEFETTYQKKIKMVDCTMVRAFSLIAVTEITFNVTLAQAEALRFSTHTTDWWYTDEIYGSTTDGSLMLATQSNDPRRLPLYFFCKDNHYTVLFQPPTSIKRPSGQGEFRYTLTWDDTDPITRGRANLRVEAVRDGGSDRAPLGENKLISLSHARWNVTFRYGAESANYEASSPAVRLFLDRCVRSTASV